MNARAFWWSWIFGARSPGPAVARAARRRMALQARNEPAGSLADGAGLNGAISLVERESGNRGENSVDLGMLVLTWESKMEIPG